jgi:hypothetical protein
VKCVSAENGTVHDAEVPDGAASPSRWMQADAAEPDIGSERDITRLGESVVKVGFRSHPLRLAAWQGSLEMWKGMKVGVGKLEAAMLGGARNPYKSCRKGPHD